MKKSGIGEAIISEIIAQGMISVAHPDPCEAHLFVWAGNAAEQLEEIIAQRMAEEKAAQSWWCACVRACAQQKNVATDMSDAMLLDLRPDGESTTASEMLPLLIAQNRKADRSSAPVASAGNIESERIRPSKPTEQKTKIMHEAECQKCAAVYTVANIFLMEHIDSTCPVCGTPNTMRPSGG